jgi:hypothetical protein
VKDTEYFARISGDNLFKQWLDKERAEAIKYLTSALDPVLIHRNQGRLQLLDEIISRVSEKNLR